MHVWDSCFCMGFIFVYLAGDIKKFVIGNLKERYQILAGLVGGCKALAERSLPDDPTV